MGAHTEVLCPTEDSSSSSDEAEETQVTTATATTSSASIELIIVRSTNPRGILRGVSDGTTPGVRVGAVWAIHTFL